MKMPLEPLQCYYSLKHLLNFPTFAGGAISPLLWSEFSFKTPTGTYDGRSKHCCIYQLETKQNSRFWLKSCWFFCLQIVFVLCFFIAGESQNQHRNQALTAYFCHFACCIIKTSLLFNITSFIMQRTKGQQSKIKALNIINAQLPPQDSGSRWNSLRPHLLRVYQRIPTCSPVVWEEDEQAAALCSLRGIHKNGNPDSRTKTETSCLGVTETVWSQCKR